jgi:hypothetical protein
MCEKHSRFNQMQHRAKADKKYVPSIYELEKLVPHNMSCPDCQCTMNWIDGDSRSQGAVLQHYRNGSIGICCLSCNTKHGLMDGDSYLDLPDGHKLCRGCQTIKPLAMFSVRRDGREGKTYPLSRCKICSHENFRKWRTENPDKYKTLNAKHNQKRKEKNNGSSI